MGDFIEDYNSDCAAVDEIIEDDFVFIIGRGTIGNNSEEALAEALLEARRVYGRNAFHIIYSKSYGVVDTLRAFKSLEEDGHKMHADLMLCIDGYAPVASRLSVSKMYDNEKGKRERRFFIPKNIKKAVALVQRRDGSKGLKIGRPSAHNRWNFVIKQKDVDEQAQYYFAYSDGYERRLKVSHFNMEEIVSTIRCCQYGGRMYTVNQLIQFHMRKYKEGKS